MKSGEGWDIKIVFIHPRGQEYFTKYCAFELCIPISPSEIILHLKSAKKNCASTAGDSTGRISRMPRDKD